MNHELAKTIGTAARQARKALRLTQEDAAERIQVSVEFYARIERGTSLPSILTFSRIVAGLGVSADSLLGVHGDIALATWIQPPSPTDGPRVARVVRQARKASPAALRIVTALFKELKRNGG